MESSRNRTRGAAGLVMMAVAVTASNQGTVAEAGNIARTVQPAAPTEQHRQNVENYRLSYQAFMQLLDYQNDAFAAYETLSLMTPQEAERAYPQGNYEAEVIAARARYDAVRDEALEAQDMLFQRLTILTGGRIPTQDELVQFHSLIGL